MAFKRVQTGLAAGSLVCFLLSAASLGLLIGGDVFPDRLRNAVTLGAFAAVMAAVGGALWVRMTVLETAFVLWEELREWRTRPGGRA